MANTCVTHEAYIALIAQSARSYLVQPVAGSYGPPDVRADLSTLDGIKLVYGAGMDGIRGVTYYQRWKPGSSAPAPDDSATVRPFVEISAFTQESHIQIAGTVIHELGHVIAGWDAGHGPLWHKACERLGLRKIKAGGTNYCLAHFAPAVRHAIASCKRPDDGQPVGQLLGRTGKPLAVKGCQAGIGTRGGKSRGVGSGSRLRLFECECVPPIKVRASRETLDATCNCCTGLFHRA